MAYLPWRFQKIVRKHGGLIKKGNLNRATNLNDLCHKCGKPCHLIRDAQGIWQAWRRQGQKKGPGLSQVKQKGNGWLCGEESSGRLGIHSNKNLYHLWVFENWYLFYGVSTSLIDPLSSSSSLEEKKEFQT